MAASLSIRLKGNKEIANTIRLLPENLRAKALNVAEQEFQIAATEAKANASGSDTTGDLISGIQVRRESTNVYFESLSPHSAFAEFGIRMGYKSRKGFESYASRFRNISINGSGKTAKEAIYEWARIKGIDKKFFYPIMMKLLGKPLNPENETGYTPINNGDGFFLQPYIDARKRIQKKLKTILKKSV